MGLLRDAGIAAGMWAAWRIVPTALLGHGWLPASQAGSVQPLLPRTTLEMIAWGLLSISAGFAEELLFRGYLQRQFHALTRNAAAAVLMQAALFGMAHGYQGPASCIRITVYGVWFGAMAQWRKSLVPGMIAHAWTDIAAGLLP